MPPLLRIKIPQKLKTILSKNLDSPFDLLGASARRRGYRNLTFSFLNISTSPGPHEETLAKQACQGIGLKRLKPAKNPVSA